MFKRKSIAAILLTMLMMPWSGLANTLCKSPDKKVEAFVQVDEEGQISYQVVFKGHMVVEPSALGIHVDGVNLGVGVELRAPAISAVSESYVTRGNNTTAVNCYNLYAFPVTHTASDRKYTLEFRLYNDGAAYRYIVHGDGVQHVDGESSSWKIMSGSKTWFFERWDGDWKLKSYAGVWISSDVEKLETASPKKLGPVQGTPLVFKLPHDIGYALVTKAATYNYSGMRLEAVGDRTVVANFREGKAGFDVEGTITSPWRVTLLADDLNELVNSDLINNLNPAPDANLFQDTSWIKPGRCAWSWESIGLGSPEDQKGFIDMAAEMGFEYSMVDDGWKDWANPWETMKSLCDYGTSNSVGVWLWVHSDDISDPANDWQQMRDYLDKVAAAGSVGIKSDFMNGETKALIDFEIACLELAAERKIMVNFHGCHASTGEERTYPNEMTREGIRGLEVNKHKNGPLPADHNAALPFTRLAVGHGDYTPVLYTNPGPTTWAHQLAIPVVFNSPLQVYAEHPRTIMDVPLLKAALPVLTATPTVWDETQVLPGSEIGDLAVFARRTGDDWMVGIINGAAQRYYQLAYSFLPAGKYLATVVVDDLEAECVNLKDVGINAKAKAHLQEWTTTIPFSVSKKLVSASTKTMLHLAQGGGAAILLEKQ